MEEKWEKKRILIWGKTRPELSKKYREIVCTGGILEDTKKLVRIYPIPLRYINDEQVFRKYQWIEAYISKSTSDIRPESYKIRPDNIKVLERIPSGKDNWDERSKWVINEGNTFSSVEELIERQKIDNTSLGLVKPKRVDKIISYRFSKKEKDEFWNKYNEALSQMELPFDLETGREIKPLSPPDYRFKIQFYCDDERCKGHTFSVLDWEADALYFKMKQQDGSPPIAAEKVREKLELMCSVDRDLYFYLGNVASHPQTFTIVGIWWPKKKQRDNEDQLSLFCAV